MVYRVLAFSLYTIIVLTVLRSHYFFFPSRPFSSHSFPSLLSFSRSPFPPPPCVPCYQWRTRWYAPPLQHPSYLRLGLFPPHRTTVACPYYEMGIEHRSVVNVCPPCPLYMGCRHPSPLGGQTGGGDRALRHVRRCTSMSL